MNGTLAIGKTIFCIAAVIAVIDGVEGKWPLCAIAALCAFIVAYLVDYAEARL